MGEPFEDCGQGGKRRSCLKSLEFGTNDPWHSDPSGLILVLGRTQRLFHQLLPVEFSQKALGPECEKSYLGCHNSTVVRSTDRCPQTPCEIAEDMGTHGQGCTGEDDTVCSWLGAQLPRSLDLP